MSSYHRTQLYMEEEQMQQLRLEAKKEHVTISELIRLVVDQFLAKRNQANWKTDSIFKTIGKIKLNTRDASVEHDAYLYSQKKSR